MNRKTIENIFDTVINDFTLKCGRVSTRASVEKAFNRIAEKYGLTLKKHEITKDNTPKPTNDSLNYDAVYTLHDKEHNTIIEFTEKFLDDNQIAYTPQGNHKNHSISLEELIQGYTNLPSTNKNSVNKIIYKYLGDGTNTNTLAFSMFEDSSAEEMNTITIPSYYFNLYNPTGNGWDNYEFTIAHESMHCLDYRTVTDREYYLRKKQLTTLNLTPSEYKELYQIKENSPYEMSKSTESYLKANGKNLDYLGWGKIEESKVDNLNKASDYGANTFSEDYAEAGAMIILGIHNPNNPKATVRWNGETMQYREWIKIHPYKAQYLAKEIFGEDISIETLLAQGENTTRNKLPTK